MSSHRTLSPLANRRASRRPIGRGRAVGGACERVEVSLPVGLLAGTAAAILLAVPAAAHAQGGGSIGTLRIVHQVQVTHSPVAPGQNANYVPARDKEGVIGGEGVRTLKRSQAEIDFTDRSILRVNERTDVVVQDSAALRNVQLRGGVVWVRVAKGVRTQVETPSATAVARGTVFTVEALPNGGGTILTVLESVVDITAGGKTVSVHAGEKIVVGGDGAMPAEPSKIPASELPIEFGGAVTGWWTTLAENVGVVSMPGGEALFDLRSSPITEAVQQLSGANIVGGGNRDFFLPTAGQRQTFFTSLDDAARSAWSQYSSNPSSYLANNGLAPLSSLGLTDSQIAALQGVNVHNVGDLVQTYSANAAAAGVTVNLDRSKSAPRRTTFIPATRSAFRPGSLTGTPNFDYRLIDRNETSLAIAGIGAAVALIADSSKLSGASLPVVSGQAFAFWTDPSLLGGRARLDGAIGQTQYHMEGDLVSLLTGDNTKTFSKADSVLYIEHPVGESVNLFAGRRRFYEGPVFQDAVQSQLIADRYSSFGGTAHLGSYALTAAYLYDSNPDVQGAQSGALASASYKLGGGQIGLHYLHAAKVDFGDGFSASVSYPVVRNMIDFYGEAGRAPDDAQIQTYGAYFPGLYQKTDTDFFVEYGAHEGLGYALSLIASRDVGKNFNVRAFTTFQDGTNKVTAGLAGVFRFSTKK